MTVLSGAPPSLICVTKLLRSGPDFEGLSCNGGLDPASRAELIAVADTYQTMSGFRGLARLKHRNPGAFICNPDVSESRHLFTFILPKALSIPPEPEPENPAPEIQKKVKGLAVFFKEAVGLSPRTEKPISDDRGGTSNLIRELRQLETKIRSSFKEEESQKFEAAVATKEAKDDRKKHHKAVAPGLSAIFRNGTKRKVESDRLPEASVKIEVLSPDMEMFVGHLISEGYFKDASFMKNGTLTPGWYKHSCGRDFIKFAAYKFGRDHQEIAKFLMSSELKKIALFGCPSVASKIVSAAKRLRVFFSMPEQTVCRRCALRKSCKFVNQQLGPKNTKAAKNQLSLLTVLRLITLYALELVPPNLTVPDEIKLSSNLLLRHTVELSRTTSKVEVQT